MNEELAEAIRIHATQGLQQFHEHISSKSKEELQNMLTELIEMYMTDKNSSTLREIVTVRVAGYEHSEGKLGYNGFKKEQGRKKMCEVKPVNVNEGERKKLNGGGNFTDYRWSRFERYSEENPNMLVSGFVSGKLIYILEFPFNCPSFKERIEEQLRRRLPHGNASGRYARSVSFYYKNYKDCAKAVFIEPKLEDYKDFLTRSFYNFLKNLRVECHENA